jgi:fructose-1,6-bisphosphatase/inositol monophosphatase family enzyme
MNLTLAEKNTLNAFYNEKDAAIYSMVNPDSSDGWLSFSLFTLLSAGAMIRKMRLETMENQVTFKPDGSPVTTTDKNIELFFRKSFKRFCPDASMLGEETGGSFPESGYSIAVDPIDGTRAFINRAATCATSLFIAKNNKPFLGLVLNPASGEICYCGDTFNTRLLQLSLFNEGAKGYDLPLDAVSNKSLLVNLHPQRRGDKLIGSFYTKWEKGEIKMVKSTGGSPALALLEVAKGIFTYVNLWGKDKSTPYDLAAGILLVRKAGGDVIGFDGNPVHLLNHEGPFIAGVDPDARKQLRDICQDSLNQSAPGKELNKNN